jgi:hypothetical protein
MDVDVEKNGSPKRSTVPPMKAGAPITKSLRHSVPLKIEAVLMA